jgi:hypothetical protein
MQASGVHSTPAMVVVAVLVNHHHLALVEMVEAE